MVRVVILARDVRVEHFLRDGVVNIKQRYRVLGNASTYVFAECAVNVNLARYGYTASGEAAVYVARNKAELRLERGSAFTSDRDVFFRAFMRFDPVEQCQFVLREL